MRLIRWYLAFAFWFLLLSKWLQKYILDPLLLFFFDTSTRLGPASERKQRLHYQSCAQRVKIWFRGSYSPAIMHSPLNFMYTHLNYLHPNEVLKRDNMTLQGVDGNYAWFCVTDKDVNVYDLKKFPFVWVAQYLMAKELILVPLWAFLRLAEEEVPDPGTDGRDVIMVFNTARCGSTLLCQMFDTLPNTRSMSEPWATVLAHANYVSGKVPKQGKVYENLIKACIKIQCKNELNKKVDRILFKQAVWGSAEMDIITRAFPKMKFIFNTRHPRSSIVSFYQMTNAPLFQSALKFQAQKLIQRLPPFPLNDQDQLCANFRTNVLEKLSGQDMREFSAIGFATGMMNYIKYRDVFDLTIIYEDLIEDPTEGSIKILKKFGISLAHLPNVLTAFKKDSQGKFFGETDGNTKLEVFSIKDWEKVDEVFHRLFVPISHAMTLDEFRAFLFLL